MSAELQEVLEFMRDSIPTKSEFNDLRSEVIGEIGVFRQEMNTRFDDMESRLDFGERIRLVEQRVAKLEDDRIDGKFKSQHAV